MNRTRTKQRLIWLLSFHRESDIWCTNPVRVILDFTRKPRLPARGIRRVIRTGEWPPSHPRRRWMLSNKGFLQAKVPDLCWSVKNYCALLTQMGSRVCLWGPTRYQLISAVRQLIQTPSTSACDWKMWSYHGWLRTGEFKIIEKEIVILITIK